jgi:hypothetical protein
MNVVEKVERVKVLKNEIKSIRVDFQTEMFDYIHQEFRKLGFITDPRGNEYERGLYNPELKISIWVQNISENGAGINVYDMINDGMNWGDKVSKVGGHTRFNYIKTSFDKYYGTTFKKQVKKLGKSLVD